MKPEDSKQGHESGKEKPKPPVETQPEQPKPPVEKLHTPDAELDGKLSKIKPQKPDILHIAPWITLAAILGFVILGYSGTYQFQAYTYWGYVGILSAIVVATGCYLYRTNQIKE